LCTKKTKRRKIMETALSFLRDNVALLATWVLGIGVVWKFVAVIKELGELLSVVAQALADKKIDNDEIKNIIKEGKDVKAVLQAALKR
jgi:Na+-transporting methylmalonyl-CoA/oxaloacetate decarboxylase gamma subunit